eukprot:m51a1_g3206 hypothetical protein (139) ;mRNA; f:20429-20845
MSDSVGETKKRQRRTTRRRRAAVRDDDGDWAAQGSDGADDATPTTPLGTGSSPVTAASVAAAVVASLDTVALRRYREVYKLRARGGGRRELAAAVRAHWSRDLRVDDEAAVIETFLALLRRPASATPSSSRPGSPETQ